MQKHYSYGRKVEEETDTVTDYESQKIKMIKNMMEIKDPGITYVANPTKITPSTDSNVFKSSPTSSLETVDTIEISPSKDPDIETGEQSMVGFILVIAVTIVTMVLLITLITLVLKNYFFLVRPENEGIK